MREIPLTKGKVTLVDDADYSSLMQRKWHFIPSRRALGGYAASRIRGKVVYMHRLVMKALPGTQIDHRDLNSLNNQRDNLRIATHAQNKQNESKRQTACTSRYKGVSWYPRNGKWRALCKKEFLGCFDNEVDAARAYDEAARICYGEFANTNF